MLQEIAVYMIIGAAIYAALSPFLSAFRKKGKKERMALNEHACGSCSAECILRESAKKGDFHSVDCKEIKGASE
jgi:hypothetical protein